MPVDKDALERALDRGSHDQLPPNVPPGMLGEVAPDLRKVDDFHPTLNAGLLQESTSDTHFLTMLLLYVLVLTSPVAAWMLWREPRRPLWVKLAVTIVGIAIYVALWIVYSRGGMLA
jgi:hypothetical protein